MQKEDICMENKQNSKERDDTMTAVSKPVTGAFILNSRKASEFMTKKVHTSSDAIRRFDERKAKAEKVASEKNK